MDMLDIATIVQPVAGLESDNLNMTDMGDTALSTGVVIKMIGMSAFAAIAHALNQYRSGGTKKMTDLLILGFIAFFFGIVSGLLVFQLVGGETPTFYGLIGVSGWLGVEMSSILTKFITNKLK
jgi:hypothetical protein